MFKLEPGLIIWTSISFGILFIFLYRFILPQIIKYLEEREMKIFKTIEEAEENKKKSEYVLIEQKQQLDEARKKADEIIDRAKNEAEAYKNEIIENAKMQSDIIINQASQDISNERNRVYAEMKEEVADLVINASSKLLSRVVTIEDHRKITEDSLREVINERD